MLARQPFPNEQERARLEAIERIDQAANRPAIVPPPQVQPPEYGGPQRDAINSLVDGVVRDVIENIAALRKQLTALEQQVLVSSAAAKATLNEQVNVCARVTEETARIGDIMDQVAQRILRL